MLVTAWSRTFPGEPAQIAVVRRFVAAVLSGAPRATVPVDLVDFAEIVASELATNAVRHSRSGLPGAFFTVTVSLTTETLRLRVTDDGGLLVPHRVDPGACAESGRGLALVAALAKEWGVEGGAPARVVWADLAVDPEPAAVPELSVIPELSVAEPRSAL